MATVSATFAQVSGQAQVITWEALTTTNVDGASVELPYFSDRSVQVIGTFGSSGNLRLQGSNDGTNWAVLQDPGGTDINITSAGIKQILPVTRYVRPYVTAGDGTTDLDVILYAAKSA